MATQKEEDMRGGSRHCDRCCKKFTPDEVEEEAKIRFSTDETSRFVDEEGFFSRGMHQRDQVCNDCFHTEVFGDNGCRVLERDVKRALQQVWNDPQVKDLYTKRGIKIPIWSEDEVKDDEGPSENVQRQTEIASSSFLSREKTCAHCGKVGDIDRCSNCKVTFFCSRSHQAPGYAKYKVEALVNDTAHPTKTRHDEKLCDSPDNSEQPSSSTWLICAHCGIKTDKLSRCARCKCTWYCSLDHHRAYYPYHKLECRLIAGRYALIADMAEAADLPPAMSTDSMPTEIDEQRNNAN